MELLEAGRVVRLHYRDGEWHERLLLRSTTGEIMEKQIGERPAGKQASVWWVVTPDGDVFPEEVAATDDLDFFVLDGHGVAPVRRARAGFTAADRVRGFAAGVNLAWLFVNSLVEVDRFDPRDPHATVPRALAAPGAGEEWRVMSEGGLIAVGQPIESRGAMAVVDGDKAILYDDAGVMLVQRVQRGGERPAGGSREAAGAAPEDDGDVRVLPVLWKGDKRQRSFTDAVEVMEFHDFGDGELDGGPSCEWYLNKVVQTGMGPVARSRAWAQENGIASGDRSVHEHHVLMKVIQVAAERDQLNLMCLECFELVIRRAQVIEAAHSYNAAIPDYSHAEDMMGWGVQRGGALVAPTLSRHTAAKAAERSCLLKEKRKYAEEMRLRKPGKGNAKGTAPPAGGGDKQ
jgi:hypothetical protein